ncbi:MAG TPA: hypothetical protein VFE51_08815 [Verrucomicrobiae bacterium]|nr:hypothetical protein [Verrucomicrobiae bacterium]
MNLIFRHRQAAVPSLAIVILALTGCVSHNRAGLQPAMTDDAADLRTLVAGSLNSIQPTTLTLEALGKPTGSCLREGFTQLASDVDRMQVDSLRFRAHAQAMRSRGGAYFDEWQRHSAMAMDPAAANLAPDRQRLLQQSFDAIQRQSQQAGEALTAFFSDVRILRRVLENAPGASVPDSTKELIRQAEEKGWRAQRVLESIDRELAAGGASPTPAKGRVQQ